MPSSSNDDGSDLGGGTQSRTANNDARTNPYPETNDMGPSRSRPTSPPSSRDSAATPAFTGSDGSGDKDTVAPSATGTALPSEALTQAAPGTVVPLATPLDEPLTAPTGASDGVVAAPMVLTERTLSTEIVSHPYGWWGSGLRAACIFLLMFAVSVVVAEAVLWWDMSEFSWTGWLLHPGSPHEDKLDNLKDKALENAVKAIRDEYGKYVKDRDGPDSRGPLEDGMDWHLAAGTAGFGLVFAIVASVGVCIRKPVVHLVSAGLGAALCLAVGIVFGVWHGTAAAEKVTGTSLMAGPLLYCCSFFFAFICFAVDIPVSLFL